MASLGDIQTSCTGGAGSCILQSHQICRSSIPHPPGHTRGQYTLGAHLAPCVPAAPPMRAADDTTRDPPVRLAMLRPLSVATEPLAAFAKCVAAEGTECRLELSR